MSLIDFHLSMPYHYFTKVHFPAHSSKSLFPFYIFTLFNILFLKPFLSDFLKN